MNSDERTEFRDVSLEIYNRLARIQNASLFAAAKMPAMRAFPLTRYETAVALARLQDKIPNLTGDKTQRLRALSAATAGASHKISPANIESLDDGVRTLQTEFADEL